MLVIDWFVLAIHLDGCNVTGYSTWSMMDTFEWTAGYTDKFGLYHVDFDDDSRPRVPKESAMWYRDLILNNGWPEKTLDTKGKK